MISPEEYKNNLLKFDLQSFLNDYSGESSLALKKMFPDTYKLLAAQLTLYPKAVSKLPAFTSSYCYLTTKGYEQASSEALAKYKASLFEGRTLIDLTGGLGIDDIAFSWKFNRVVSVDSELELNLIAEVNFRKLGIQNIERVTANAEDYIKSEISGDLVYIDADRRADRSGKKAVTFHNSSPDILNIIGRLFKITPRVLLKLSPLTDITYIKKNLGNLKHIRVISLKNEVKEILLLLDKDHAGLPVVTAVDIDRSGNIEEFSGNESFEHDTLPDEANNYFFEPAASLVKAGLADCYAEKHNFVKISDRGKYYTSIKVPVKLFGRVFRVVSYFKFSKSLLAAYLRESSIGKANVSVSNFPVKPDEIKKAFRIMDGGDDYLFFTTGNKKEKLFYHCRKL